MLYAAHRNAGRDYRGSRHRALQGSGGGERFAELVYNGLWYAPLRESPVRVCRRDPEVCDRHGVKLKLYKGNCIGAGVTSPYSLYMEDIATFGDSGEMYSHKDAAGFINLYGLPLKVQAMMKEKAGLEK